MANILVNIEKGIEVAAEDVLKWLVGAGKALHAAPAAIAALATMVAALEKPLAELGTGGSQSVEYSAGYSDGARPEGCMARGEGVPEESWREDVMVGDECSGLARRWCGT